MQIDFVQPQVCRKCGAIDSQRVDHTMVVNGQRRRYWVCRKCGARGVRVTVRNLDDAENV